MLNTLTDVIEYFRSFAQEHVELESFIHGTTRRVISLSRSDTKYPALWLETPILVLTDKDGTAPSGQRRAALVVVDSIESGNDEAKDIAMARTEGLLLEVLSRLRHDRRELKFTFSLQGSVLEPVAPISAANEVGYRVEIAFDKPVAFCYNPDRWTKK